MYFVCNGACLRELHTWNSATSKDDTKPKMVRLRKEFKRNY